jgi:(2S)-methylsuccinyl-CoA dehydrogenase
MASPQLADARVALSVAAAALDGAVRRLADLAARDGVVVPALLDEHQVVAYDLAHGASALAAADAMLEYGTRGELESLLAATFVADAVAELAGRFLGRDPAWGLSPEAFAPAIDFVGAQRAQERIDTLAAQLPTAGSEPCGLPDDLEAVRATFRRFAAQRIRPVAESVHREDLDVPEDVIRGIAELGGFGLSVPAGYGGHAGEDGRAELAMVVATEELSWGSLGIGGSLVTRPEILTRALLRGGTEAQKQRWLPGIAAGELMVAVLVTEPDFGSDVAGLTLSATRGDDGWTVNGTKTFATFAGRADLLMLLARTDPDRSLAHRGLSLFVVEKEPSPGRAFECTQPGGGRITGRAIPTIGYRGMHSYEVGFTDWVVPADQLVGGDAGEGRGFYLQMEGFENGRLQTAARAVGVMQAAFEEAAGYARARQVFGRPVADYALTRAKLVRMAVLVQAGRQFAYRVAALMGRGEGALEASMVKDYVCRAAEWVTREAMQLHGGLGYAEEVAVSRYFVDARVLSIFEGADETLCLRVITRRLAEDALARSG